MKTSIKKPYYFQKHSDANKKLMKKFAYENGDINNSNLRSIQAWTIEQIPVGNVCDDETPL